MQSPYLPLFEHDLKMSVDDRRRVGLTTALLYVRRQLWVHRRVELVTFEDHDVMRRSNSIDFTFPEWALESLGVSPSEPTQIAVPITLLRKSALVHFKLTNEGSDAVPLLSGTQAGPLAEMALLATAELALNRVVPQPIACDIKRLTWDRRASEDDTRRQRLSAIFHELFSPAKQEPEARAALKEHPIFLPLAETFDTNYIGAVLLRIKGGDRRVIHFAYDEVINTLGNEQRRAMQTAWNCLEEISVVA
jgi:hypothetical protein